MVQREIIRTTPQAADAAGCLTAAPNTFGSATEDLDGYSSARRSFKKGAG